MWRRLTSWRGSPKQKVRFGGSKVWLRAERSQSSRPGSTLRLRTPTMPFGESRRRWKTESEVPSINRGAGVREEEERQTRPAGVAALAPPRPSQAPWRLNPSLVVRKLPGAERIARLAAVIVGTGRCADLCRSNASSHQRRNTTPAPTRRTAARRDGRRTGAARAGSTGKTQPTHKSVGAADDTWSFRAGAEAPRRCRDNGGRDGSSRRACPICRGSFDYLDTTRREGIGQRAGGGRHTPDPSRATSRVGCGTDRQRRIRTVVRLCSDTCRTGHEHRSDAAGQSSVVTSERRPGGGA